MKTIRTLLSSSTILPSLFLSSFVNVQSVIASPAAVGPMVIAQGAATPTEEELRRRQEQEKHQHQPGTPPAANTPHQAPPVVPAQQKAEPQVQPPTHVVPATPVTPPKPIVPVQPAPNGPVQGHTQPTTPSNPAAPAGVQRPAVNPSTHIEPVVPVKPATPVVTPTPVNPPKPATPIVTPTPVAPRAVEPVQPQAPNSGAATPVQPHVNPSVGTPVNPSANPGTPHTPPGVQPQQQTQQPGAPVNPQVRPATPQATQPGIQPRPVAPNTANQPSTMAPQFPAQPQQAQQPGNPPPKRNGMTPLEGVAIGAAVGVVGGMIIGQQVHGLGEVQSSRREVEQNGATFYSEPGRVIVREGDGLYVRHDETERFREFGSDVRVEQRGDQTVQIVRRPDGSQIITITDSNGELLKRLRRLPNGAEVVLIDNSFRPRPRHFSDEIVTIAPPPMTLPPDQYDVDADRVDEGRIYETLQAPPLASLPRRYTLDEVRYSRDLRQYMRSVDLTTITFSTGSWAIEDSQVGSLQAMADAINRAVRANPNEIFLVEGHTDAVGSDVDNLSLSDRRAQSVAGVLTRNFNVPPENLTTQGYGSQFLKIQTSEAERANRRVTIRRVTPLLTGSNGR